MGRWLIAKAENYKPRFPISSGAPCAIACLFASVQHCLEMLVHYLVTLSYKPQQSQAHNRRLHCISAGQCFYNDMRFVLRVKARTAAHHSAYILSLDHDITKVYSADRNTHSQPCTGSELLLKQWVPIVKLLYFIPSTSSLSLCTTFWITL